MAQLDGFRIAILHHTLTPLVAIEGVSDSPRDDMPGTRRIDYDGTPTSELQTLAYAIADAHNTLEVSSTEPIIYVTPPPGKTDTTVITITNLTTWDYRIFTSTNLKTPIVEGTVNDGNLTLTFTDSGTYVVEAQSTNHATGYVEIEAR